MNLKKDKEISLILGVNGQDGSYLAEALLSKGNRVVGVGRQEGSKYIQKRKNFSYRQLDIAYTDDFELFLRELSPKKIFHVAAIHGSSGFNYEENWLDAHRVNLISVQAILEYLRCIDKPANLIYLSSSKAFGLPLPKKISEESERRSTCIYSVTKNAATDLIHYYRDKHSVTANVLWTFNHESVRRGKEYFIPKVIECLATSIENPEHTSEIYTLNFYSDWSDAEELMNIVLMVGDDHLNSDFILASGKTVFARDFVQSLFKRFDLDYRNHIREINPNNNDDGNWQADISKMRHIIGVEPKLSIHEICLDLLEQKSGLNTSN